MMAEFRSEYALMGFVVRPQGVRRVPRFATFFPHDEC